MSSDTKMEVEDPEREQEAGPSTTEASKSSGGTGGVDEKAAIAKCGTRVYVGNLSWDTRWQALKDHMRDAGEVVHAEIFQESTGRSAGCGIVEFESSADAQNAIKIMNDTTLDGRSIFVREDREEGKSGGRVRHPRRSEVGRKIVVWNLPYSMRWQNLKDLFRESGDVIRAEVPERDGRSKGMGTVLFETEEDAKCAIEEWNGKEIDGRIIDCRLDRYAQ